MKKKNIPVEFVYQLFALIISIIIVHAFYVSVVRPTAAQVIEEQNMQAAADPDFVRERSVWVLTKDMEQEACFILMFWALAIMGYKAVQLGHERRLCRSRKGCEYCPKIRASLRVRCRHCRRTGRKCCCQEHC